jgi:hypothetical protein
MTINKAQGQTLEFAGIQLETQPFAHGQLYVAMSRVGSPDNIKVLKFTPHSIGASRHITNKFVSAVLHKDPTVHYPSRPEQ